MYAIEFTLCCGAYQTEREAILRLAACSSVCVFECINIWVCNYQLVRLSDNEQQQYVVCGDSNNVVAIIPPPLTPHSGKLGYDNPAGLLICCEHHRGGRHCSSCFFVVFLSLYIIM